MLTKIEGTAPADLTKAAYPFEAYRALIAALFARRICGGMATGPEVEFMCKFMDMNVDGEWFEDMDAYADAIRALVGTGIGEPCSQQPPEAA